MPDSKFEFQITKKKFTYKQFDFFKFDFLFINIFRDEFYQNIK